MRRFLLIFVAAPIAAAALIVLLLLLGATPHLVFLPGHALLDALARAGTHAPKAVGVITTEIFWWVVVVSVGWAVARVRAK